MSRIFGGARTVASKGDVVSMARNRPVVRFSKDERTSLYEVRSRHHSKKQVVEVEHLPKEVSWGLGEKDSASDTTLKAGLYAEPSIIGEQAGRSDDLTSGHNARSWSDLRSIAEAKHLAPEPTSEELQKEAEEEQRYSDYTDELAEQRRKEEAPICRRTHTFPGSGEVGAFDVVELSQRASAVVNMAKSDVQITEVLFEEDTPQTDLPHSETGYVRVVVEYEGMTTPAMAAALCAHLGVSIEACRVVSCTFHTAATMCHTLEITTSSLEEAMRAKLSPFYRTLSNLAKNSNVISGPAVVDNTTDAVTAFLKTSAAAAFPYRETLLPDIEAKGSLIVKAYRHSEARLSSSDIAGYETQVLLRDVRGERVGEKIASLGKVGALNLVPNSAAASSDGWLRTGTAALNGNYRLATSLLLEQMSAAHPSIERSVTKLLSLYSRAKVEGVGSVPMNRTERSDFKPFAQEENDAGHDSGDVTIRASDIIPTLDAIPAEVSWVGTMIFAFLTDTGMRRFERIWKETVPRHIQRQLLKAPSDFLFNKMAVERITRYGPDPVRGDLVRTQLGAVKLLRSDDDVKEAVRSSILLPYPQLSRGTLWCKDVKFPKHAISQAAYEVFLRQHDMFPHYLHPSQFVSDVAWNAHRSLLARPRIMEIPVGSFAPGKEGPEGMSLVDPVMASAVSVAVFKHRKIAKNATSPRFPRGLDMALSDRIPGVPPPPTALPGEGFSEEKPAEGRKEVLDKCLQKGVVLTRSQWSHLLLRSGNVAPAPPTPYSDAWECADCEELNHPTLLQCGTCSSAHRKQYDAEDGVVDARRGGGAGAGGGLRHIALALATKPGEDIEAVLSEVFALHHWSGYADSGSKQHAKMANLTVFA